jgi:hypothetical protein
MESPPEELVRRYRSVSSGALRLLSIEALKEQLGAKWETKLDQMKFVVESIIRRHLQDHAPWSGVGASLISRSPVWFAG